MTLDRQWMCFISIAERATRRRRALIVSRTRGEVALLATFALLMSASLGAPPAYSSESKRCGTVSQRQVSTGANRNFGIKARGTSCKTARRMVKQWYINVLKRGEAGSSNYVPVFGFTCKAPSNKVDRLIDCRKSGARVTWHQGVPLDSCIYSKTCFSDQAIDGGALRV